MDDTTKILSVSYGNFSCHLEGFDDSVKTMKTVVSYFHDLAGHDRFMDMEPQAPDMETLASLTEEQTGAPVVVEADGNAVSMRVAAAVMSDEIEAAVDNVAEAVDDDYDGDTIVLNSQDQDIAADPVDAPIEEESVADKLQRIRAVVDHDVDAEANDDAPADDADTFTEDLADADSAPTAAPGNPLAQRLAELAKRNAEKAAEEAGIALELDDEDDLDLTPEELAELDAEFEAEEAEDHAQITAPAEDAVADTLPETEADFADAEMAEAAIEDAVDDLEELAMEDAVDDQAADTAAEDGPLILEDGPLVLKDATPLTDDDEAARAEDYDLQEDIANAQREITAQEEDRSKRSDLRDAVDANMSRILSQTDEHLKEPEGRRHRDAFAQLKAAVAATEAARQLGDAGDTARDKNEVFRDDLGALGAEDAEQKAATEDNVADDFADDGEAAKVEDTAPDMAPIEEQVTEPEVETAKAVEEPAAPAPLKLVSSQPAKTTSDASLDAASARLRNIASQKETSAVSKNGFADFASAHDATELADLLEAAAAYIAFVEGEDSFSRPQVMKKVQSASATEFSREDGLRAFGRLLRQNRLSKLTNGRFQVAESTRFRPGTKAAQG